MSYAIYVGASLTADGCAYLAGYGDEPSSHWLELAPRAEHPADATIEVGVTEASLMPGVRTAIPQAPVTARHLRVDVTGRLVGEQQLGLPDHCAGDRGALLFTAR